MLPSPKIQVSTVPTFTVFDTETTGLSAEKGDKIVEIAGVRVENGVILEDSAFVRLVNPERSIPWEAKSVHKIDDADVANEPTIDIILPEFLEFAAGSTLVAHNARFDLSFLQVEKECCWGYIDLPDCLCTMKLSKHVFPTEFRHNLDVLSTRLGIFVEGDRHRALPDVIMTAKALLKMAEISEMRDIEKLMRVCGMAQAVR